MGLVYRGDDRNHHGRMTVGIYCGTGASHSWVWMVDALEVMKVPMEFLHEDDVAAGRMADLRALVVTGGDTLAIAEALGENGARQIGTFVGAGGLYLGTCAGACLVIGSSRPPLNAFNFVPARIANISSRLPEHFLGPERYSTPYGDDVVFQPVRGEVKVRFEGTGPFDNLGDIVAPVFGGPSLVVKGHPDDTTVPARYEGFTGRTLFLTDRGMAEETLMGRGAVVIRDHGMGQFIVCGPHFEHPRYPAGRRFLAAALMSGGGSRDWMCPSRARGTDPGRVGESCRHEIRLEMSNCRILAMGLERSGIEWSVGSKIYDAEKILTLLNSAWKRVHRMTCNEEEGECILLTAKRVRGLLRDAVQGRGDQDAGGLLVSAVKDLTVQVLRACMDSACTTSRG